MKQFTSEVIWTWNFCFGCVCFISVEVEGVSWNPICPRDHDTCWSFMSPHGCSFSDSVLCSNATSWASLVAQWLRICLLMQGTRVQALVWEDPTCRGATRPVSHNYWACASGACAPQQERLRQWEARAPRWRVAPACRN